MFFQIGYAELVAVTYFYCILLSAAIDDSNGGDYKSFQRIQTQCQTCLPGAFANNSLPQCHSCSLVKPGTCYNITSCSKCPPGHFQNASGAVDCLPCPSGMFANLPGSSQCTPCPPGSYASAPGQTDCLPCSKGFYQPSKGSQSCLECPDGTESLTAGSAVCTQCNAGHYKNSSVSIQCLPCPAGTSSNQTGASQCPECPPGAYSLIGQVYCSPCPVSTYCNVTGCDFCERCPLGMFTADVGSRACVCCGPGMYRGHDDRTCQKCGTGYYSKGYCKSTCQQCPPDYYCPCSYCKYACPAESICPAGSSHPNSCPYLTKSSSDKQTCVWTDELYTIVIGSICGAVLLIAVLLCSVYWNKINPRRRQDRLSDERAPLAVGNASYSAQSSDTDIRSRSQTVPPATVTTQISYGGL